MAEQSRAFGVRGARCRTSGVPDSGGVGPAVSAPLPAQHLQTCCSVRMLYVLHLLFEEGGNSVPACAPALSALCDTPKTAGSPTPGGGREEHSPSDPTEFSSIPLRVFGGAV